MLTIGATNRPDMIDEAVRRRFTRRILIPLPDIESRRQVLEVILTRHKRMGGRVSATDADIVAIAELTAGYSSQDMTEICKAAGSAAFLRSRERITREHNGAGGAAEDGPEGQAVLRRYAQLRSEDLDPVTMGDLRKAVRSVRPSVSAGDVERHNAFDAAFGWHGATAASQEGDADF